MSSSQKDSLSLSVRDGESVKHYRIRRFDNGLYYVATRAAFSTLNVSLCAYLVLTSVDLGQCDCDWLYTYTSVMLDEYKIHEIMYTIQEMIAHYKTQSDGLAQMLVFPCPRGAPNTAGLSYRYIMHTCIDDS